MASSTPPTTTGTTSVRPPTVTPSLQDDSLSKRMSVERGIVDELLLVCGVIGSTDPASNEFIPVTDCLNWLQDMQRALRRDDDTYRPISLLIGNWKVVQQKLLPLVLTCRYDNPMVLTVVKILVILTKPLSDTTKRAGRMVIDTKSRKVPDDVIKEQIKLRENALAQSDMLMEYKRAITHHSSHLTDQKGGLLSIFVSLLAEPLSKTGTARTDTDHLTIELVLHLFRNLLSAEPILKGSTEASQKSAQLHHELINLFEKELVLEILYVIAQDMESRENAQYNLLMMELLNHLLRNQDPTAVARSTMPKPKKTPPPPKEAAKSTPSVGPTKPKVAKAGSLLAELQREKQTLRPTTTSRHSHFGGTLVVKRQDGKRQYMSAALVEKGATQPAAQKRKNRKTDPFIGSGRTCASHSRIITQGGPAAAKAQRTLNTFCSRFVKDCYGPLMKSIKNEFRRDSSRLEEGDKVVFFRIVWFFSQWWRVAGRKAQQDTSNALGQLIFTMDVFTFNLVLNATDTYQQHKKYTQLAQTAALYSEMMQLLHIMYHSKDSTENLMALGLLDRLYYGSEPVDRLPKLLSKWTPGTSTREYVCDLVELVHVTLKLLEANAEACTVTDAPSKDKAKNDAVTRMKQNAADFDLTSYIVRKIVSNQVVFMYTHLLSHYIENAPHVNHHIAAFFLRFPRLQVAVGGDNQDRTLPASHPLALKTVTLEPMLYNIQLIVALDRILNDATIRNEKEYAAIINFAAGIMSRFASNAQANPMLPVECLFRHPVPHRFCELLTNMYVNEEMILIAERDLLLETAEDEEDELEGEAVSRRSVSTRASGQICRQSNMNAPGDDDDEEEVEWDDEEKDPGTEKAEEASRSSSKKSAKDNDEEEGPLSPAASEKRNKDAEKESDDEPLSPAASEKSVKDAQKDNDDEPLSPAASEKSVKDADKDSGDEPLSPAASEKSSKDDQKDNDDEQWSDRRPFVPKRKLLADIDPNASPEKKQRIQKKIHDESSADIDPNASPEKKQRIQKKIHDESSDDEDEFEGAPAPSGDETKRSNRLVIDDDDDDE